MPFDPNILNSGQKATANALSNRSKAQQTVAGLNAKINLLEGQLPFGDPQLVQQQIAELKVERVNAQKLVLANDQTWRDSLASFAINIDPCDADPTVPLLLLPVRLETRYTTDGTTLRIRMFPDDIHIDQLERGLSADEQVASRTYWTTISNKTDEALLNEAWRTLVIAVGDLRAPWVATGMTPTNPGGSEPVFPQPGPPQRRAAIARLLPDRFVAVALQSQGTVRSDQAGGVISPELVLGLLADDGSERITVNGVQVPAGAEWIVDYDRAVAAGMAMNLKLKLPRAPVDRLFVFGVRSSLDPARTAHELESLLTGHRCARGMAMLAQGTPTNNTESDRSAWSAKPSPTPPARAVAAPNTNAAALASALAVDSRIFAGLPGADLTEQANARNFNTCLWSPTWGSFLDKITTVNRNGATLSDTRREQSRTFFRDFVHARGPLPALRVGMQAYGILPVSPVAGPRWKSNDDFENALLPLLRRIRTAWVTAASDLPRVGSGKPIDETLRSVLGTSPTSLGLRVRSVLSGEFAQTGAQASGAITDSDLMGHIIEQLILEEVVLNASFTRPIGSLEKKSRPLGLPLVDETDAAAIDAIVAGQSPKIASVLQALLALSWDASVLAVKQAAPFQKIGSVAEAATALSPTLRAKAVSVSRAASNSSSVALHAFADELTAVAGEAGSSRLAELQPSNNFRSSIGEVALSAVNERSSVAGWALAAWFRETAKQAELKEAMLAIKGLSSGDRRVLLCETLDLSSHRLDAWITGFIERRRQSLRTTQPNGIAVGAYGWVENIVPAATTTSDGGYIHTPSLDHAATAGILRSAYLTHNPANGGTGAFAVDLSSNRVRIALDILDGVRQGQPLGALIGYRIERALHEKRLDRLVLTLRSLAPLAARRLTDRSEAAGTQAQASVAANNVVDGLRLLALFKSNAGSIKSALNDPPKDNPYIPPGTWPPLTPDEWIGVQAILKDAEQTVDAAADLVLAESVHQLARGNTVGASASLDSIAAGDSPPPEPDFIRTPALGAAFTHRLAIASSATLINAAQGWNASRPRAQAEPRLEQWAKARLGDAMNITVQGTITLDAAKLCALDIIYESGDPASLEQRVRSVTRGDPNQPLDAALLATTAFAGSLRSLLVNAQPAKPQDFVRSSEPPTRAFSEAEVSAAADRARNASGGLEAARDHLKEAIATFDVNDAAPLRQRLEEIAAFGVVTPIAEGEHLLAVAHGAEAEASRRITEANLKLTGTPDAAKITEAGQSLFGEGFWILPAISPPATPDVFSTASGVPSPARAAMRRFILDQSSVRGSAARFSEALLAADALGKPMPLRVAQLGGGPWVGGLFDPTQPTPRASLTNLMLLAPADLDPAEAFIALTIDGWTDMVPLREKRGSAADSPIDNRHQSGLAVNANGANARPPQALLLAISPDAARWTTNALLDTLSETLEMAKLRGVTLETSPGYARVLPAAYEKSWSLQGEKVFDLSAIAKAKITSAILKYVKEV